MEIKAVKFRKDGFYGQPFAFGGEEGPQAFDPAVRYRGSLQNYLIDTGDEVILVDTGLPAGTPEEMPDEQSAEPMPEANQIKPVFTEADAPAPQEPAEAPKEAAREAPAPEPEPEPIPAPEAPTEPVNEPQEEKLPWEDDQDNNFDLFKA